ncbi:MAG: CADD family putative folate metabolism protein, partial [Candidatus Neomarinimicrobiota bacterium]
MTPEEKSAADHFLEALDRTIARYGLLEHPFYECWSAGELTKETLVEYAKQYYAHVAAFPTYVSAVHTQCEELPVRQMLLENLIEEERGTENHPELWLRFGESLGVPREELLEAELLPETAASVDTMKRLTHSPNFLAGLAALYAYESQIPEVSYSKREGLKSYYDIDDERSTAFFRVHEEADIWHRQVERGILASHAAD